ncbi:YqeB family protein [Staphylococcus equorum]|uniref:YqeB family protein n=1 Tax=Staphylococcus equorum TaxID=246432 RepID=UPI0008535401|nr:hypothetical protein [Staphylococcus equorum]OEK59852.1 hypothetical protein ASS99_12170 [Staphylococcus equorum]
MKNEDTIGPGFLEKLLIILSPLIIGIIGYFLPKTLFLIKKIPIVSDMKIIKLIESFNPFWTSITLAIIGLIIGIFFSLIIFDDCLKVTINNQNVKIEKNDIQNQTKLNNIKEAFMENKSLIIILMNQEILINEITDVKENKVKSIFKNHGIKWHTKSPYDYILWTLQNNSFNEKINSILYERRNAIRDGDNKKVENLKKDLNEIGVIVIDKNNKQYVHKLST